VQRHLIAIACVIALGLTAVSAIADPPAEVVLRHGKIHTQDPTRRVVQALALRGNAIVAVGTDRTTSSCSIATSLRSTRSTCMTPRYWRPTSVGARSTLPGRSERATTQPGDVRPSAIVPVSYPHSTQWGRTWLKRRIWNSTGSAMAYVRFAQILYRANRTSGPSDSKIKRR
jgi:hypothetical protein